MKSRGVAGILLKAGVAVAFAGPGSEGGYAFDSDDFDDSCEYNIGTKVGL